jgi:hypothetical protein
MAMRRATASKGDAIVNSLHALMDQIHRKVPGFHDSSSSLNCSNLSWNTAHADTTTTAIPAHVPSVLDCVFHDKHEPGPGGLSHEQTIELRALSVKTSDRLKNLYCNAVGLAGNEEVADASQLQRAQSPMMRKTSVANRDDEFINDVDYIEGRGGVSETVHRPTPVSFASSGAGQPNQWTTFHDQDGISVSEFSHSDYPMDTLMASCYVEVG